MSLKNEDNESRDSVDIISNLNQDNSLKDVPDARPKARIQSIDFVKGLAMIFIILCHAGAAWLDEDWVYTYALVYTALDILGPSLFVFLSALSVVFSIKSKQGKIPEKVLKSQIYTRGFVIMFIGMLYNLIGFATVPVEGGYPFPLNLWGWNILMFIGFSQIVSYHVIKLKKQMRALIGVAIILISPILREFIFVGKDTNFGLSLAHYLITSPAPQVTLLPWLAICFFSTIFGEYLQDAMKQGPGDAYIKLFRIFLIWGVIFILLGIFCPLPQPEWQPGFALQTSETLSVSEYPHFDLWRVMNQQNYIYIPGMPLFLIRGTSSAMIYQLGGALLIIGLSFGLIDIKNKDNSFITMLIFYGKVSLSLFLLHYTFIPLYLLSFNIVFFPIMVLSYIGFLGFMFYVWFEYFEGKWSPEWMMGRMGGSKKKPREGAGKGVKKVAEKSEN